MREREMREEMVRKKEMREIVREKEVRDER